MIETINRHHKEIEFEAYLWGPYGVAAPRASLPQRALLNLSLRELMASHAHHLTLQRRVDTGALDAARA